MATTDMQPIKEQLTVSDKHVYPRMENLGTLNP